LKNTARRSRKAAPASCQQLPVCPDGTIWLHAFWRGILATSSSGTLIQARYASRCLVAARPEPETTMTQHDKTYRVGIDVGGTFTKAVLIDNGTRAVVDRYATMTTHADERGVAAGVLEVFREVLARSGIAPSQIVFLAHSTTQATNALLEGDVAKVGVLAMAGANAAKLAEPQSHIDPIALAPGRTLDTANRFLVADDATPDIIEQAIAELRGDGADVLVASAAFGVDNTNAEETVRDLGRAAGLLTTCGHEITRLYGLQTRTRTAVINASILPKMNETASLIEDSVHEAGIRAPVMIMRGDGGVMDIGEMRRRPAMTMLSGPAASVAGALMHGRVSDGIYFEVGGTSSNLGVIRSGRPAVSYANVGGHDTYVSSLDVRVVGVAGGSLIRARPDAGVVDVGPRSAHIAGLPYAAFAPEADLAGATVVLFEPKPGDGADFAALETPTGKRFAITTTCAANALGLTTDDMHCSGNRASARLAFAALAAFIGGTPEAAAEAVLTCATDKITPVIAALRKAYDLDDDQSLLVGEGGGAGALVPFTARRLGLPFQISQDAEVISSIGVALAMVRETVERIIPHHKPEDIAAIRQEAVDAVVRLGAHPKTVSVAIDIDPTTQLVRATATGSAEMQSREADGSILEVETRRLAAQSMDLTPGALALIAAAPEFRLYQEADSPGGRLRLVDGSGTIRLRRANGEAVCVTASDLDTALGDVWRNHDLFDQARAAEWDVFVAIGSQLIDLSAVADLDTACMLAAADAKSWPADEPAIVIACHHQRD
jgi:N-methylhydantoinase A